SAATAGPAPAPCGRGAPSLAHPACLTNAISVYVLLSLMPARPGMGHGSAWLTDRMCHSRCRAPGGLRLGGTWRVSKGVSMRTDAFDRPRCFDQVAAVVLVTA